MLKTVHSQDNESIIGNVWSQYVLVTPPLICSRNKTPEIPNTKMYRKMTTRNPDIITLNTSIKLQHHRKKQMQQIQNNKNDWKYNNQLWKLKLELNLT